MADNNRVDAVKAKIIEIVLAMEAKGYPVRGYLPDDMRFIVDYAQIRLMSKRSFFERISPEWAIKTYSYYLRTISTLVRQLYGGEISESSFVDRMADLVQAQLIRAWNEGMRENGLDPQEEMKEEWITKRDELILNEYNFVDGFAADIVAGSKEEASIDGFLARAEVWANRYNDVVNISIVTTKEQKLKWELGATEEHCATCAALNGIVAWASEWELAGVRPQNPPNSSLECGGWRCDCRLTPTTERHTRGAWNRIMSASM